jgi:hypothetical protein
VLPGDMRTMLFMSRTCALPPHTSQQGWRYDHQKRGKSRVLQIRKTVRRALLRGFCRRGETPDNLRVPHQVRMRRTDSHLVAAQGARWPVGLTLGDAPPSPQQ